MCLFIATFKAMAFHFQRYSRYVTHNVNITLDSIFLKGVQKVESSRAAVPDVIMKIKERGVSLRIIQYRIIIN